MLPSIKREEEKTTTFGDLIANAYGLRNALPPTCRSELRKSHFVADLSSKRKKTHDCLSSTPQPTLMVDPREGQLSSSHKSSLCSVYLVLALNMHKTLAALHNVWNAPQLFTSPEDSHRANRLPYTARVMEAIDVGTPRVL